MYIVKTKKRGRGVYASKNIKNGEVIEECELIIIPKKEVPLLEKTRIDHYYYHWNYGRAAIALGYGSLYNHSYDPNSDIRFDYEKEKMIFFALKPIKAHEEITVNYHEDPEDRTPFWFKVVEKNSTKKKPS